VSTPTDEEARAKLWRDNQRARIKFQRDLWLSLQAPPGPAQAVRDAWAPVLAWQIERDIYIDPEEDP
jgi:hypothetical protein